MKILLKKDEVIQYRRNGRGREGEREREREREKRPREERKIGKTTTVAFCRRKHSTGFFLETNFRGANQCFQN